MRAAPWGNLRACGANAVTTTFDGGLAMQPAVLSFFTCLPSPTEAEVRQGGLHRAQIGIKFVTLQKKALPCHLPAESKTTIAHVAISPSHSRWCIGQMDCTTPTAGRKGSICLPMPNASPAPSILPCVCLAGVPLAVLLQKFQGEIFSGCKPINYL